jgi:DsbC/DsbD-like thiol-disulfide interchange protein
MKLRFFVYSCALLIALGAFAQRDTLGGPKKAGPSVTLVSTGPVAISKTKPTKFALTFRVADGYHVNSHTPKSENLIATSLKLDPPQDIAVGRLTYPAGHDFEFDFAPGEKLSVYEGDFTVNAIATTTANVATGTYKMRGDLTYQACDKAQCYPPKKAPVEFDVKVQNTAARGKRNPGQSPHVR